jgi:hypothetical protein
VAGEAHDSFGDEGGVLPLQQVSEARQLEWLSLGSHCSSNLCRSANIGGLAVPRTASGRPSRSDLSPPHAWVEDWLDHTGPDPEFRIYVSATCTACPPVRELAFSAPQPAPALPLSAAGALAAHQRHELLALNPRAECLTALIPFALDLAFASGLR